MPMKPIIPAGAQKPIAPYSPGAQAGNIVYTSGVLPLDQSNNVAYVGDAKAQTKHVLDTICSILAAAGGTMDDVAFNAIFLSDWKHYAAMNEVYAEYFPGDKPARYCVQCGLAKSDALVEIAATAHVTV